MQRLTLVVTDEYAERLSYWKEFLEELAALIDGHFDEGKWYLESGD